MTKQLNSFFSLQVLTCFISASKLNHRFWWKSCDNLSSLHFCMLIGANNEFFTASNCQNININPRKTNRHHLYKRRKGQEVHLFDIYTLSDIRRCQGIETMIPLSKRETPRMKDRQAVWKRKQMGKKERALQTGDKVSGFTLKHPFQLFICCCSHREWGCTDAPLTHFFSLSKVNHCSEAQSSVIIEKSTITTSVRLHAAFREEGPGL